MKKFIFGLSAIAIVITGIFTFTGCEKEESTGKVLNIQKSNAALTGMYEVVDETGGVFLNLEDSNYISMSIVKEPASGTGAVETVRDNDVVTGIKWHCNTSEAPTNCGVAREIHDKTGETIRTGTWIESNGGMLVVFQP